MIGTFVAALALQASQAGAPRRYRCDDPQNQVEMTACAGIDFERADAELNATWRKAIARARSADREFEDIRGADDRPGSEAVLREAQRAWIIFRDAHCTLNGYDARGGTMEPMLYNGCRARITRERTFQLRSEEAAK